MSHQSANPVCPRCGADTSQLDASVAACPHCACVLVGATAGDDEALVAELRAAFAHDDAETGDKSGPGLASWIAAGRTSAPGRGALPALESGTRLGDFEILGELGRGGMGVVYRARQISLGREVALKILPSYAQRGPRAVQRFLTEAQAAARLHHTNVVSIYAQGEHDGLYFYAMELVDGVGLDTVIRSRPDLLSSTHARHSSSLVRLASSPPGPRTTSSAPDVARRPDAATEPTAPTESPRRTGADYRHVAALFAEIADALAYAHREGVIHRDIKPHNLLLGADQQLHLTDFGLARLTDAPHLTTSGEIMGTPAYLSPEQIRGKPGEVDPRTDIYSLGVTLYEVLTRKKPFEGQTRDQIIHRICTDEPRSLRQHVPQIPLDIETICLRAIEKAPERRYPTALDLAEDLRRFAQGRPILSRRVTPLEKAVKWVRRHKAVTTAAAAVGGVCILTALLAALVITSRQREANAQLEAAFDQLAYYDYHNADAVADELDAARALGADAAGLALTDAVVALGQNRSDLGFERVSQYVDSKPDDPTGWYVRAWAEFRLRRGQDARASFERAEALGPPLTPAAWFFRGIAAHYWDPQLAIASYREANARRAAQNAFYPQALLHLARARNQQLYATRSLDGFSEAEATLRQLIDHGYYEAYPYYLLSITHRLAGEIYRGSTGTRGDQAASEHFEQALHWARAGQQRDPTNDRPITAEAECLESMGEFEAAVEARTRAIAIADSHSHKCEGYHYRWRLFYWLGNIDAALADCRVHAECMPESVFYRYVYPALLRAETGALDEAREHATALWQEFPDQPDATIWAASLLRLIGDAEAADELLDDRASELDFSAGLAAPQTATWMAALYEFVRGRATLHSLEAIADNVEQPWKLWGEARFHAGVMALASGDRAIAEQHLHEAYRAFDGEVRYTYHAKLILEKMRRNPQWPSWLMVSSEKLPATTQVAGGRTLTLNVTATNRRRK